MDLRHWWCSLGWDCAWGPQRDGWRTHQNWCGHQGFVATTSKAGLDNHLILELQVVTKQDQTKTTKNENNDSNCYLKQEMLWNSGQHVAKKRVHVWSLFYLSEGATLSWIFSTVISGNHLAVVAVAFSSLARILGQFSNSFPASTYKKFFKWRSAPAHQFHILGKDQFTAQWDGYQFSIKTKGHFKTKFGVFLLSSFYMLLF